MTVLEHIIYDIIKNNVNMNREDLLEKTEGILYSKNCYRNGIKEIFKKYDRVIKAETIIKNI